jgi:formylglycine-generating enzyme required for sulfatase activity
MVKEFKIIQIFMMGSILICNSECKKTEMYDPFDIDCPKYIFTPYDFTAIRERNTIKLEWKQNELNISGFVLEKKHGLEQWVKVATLEKNIFTWIDQDIVGEELYKYRLYAYAGDNKSIIISVQIIPVFDFTISVSGISIDMVGIEGATFYMGSASSGGEDDEKPRHIVTVNSFYIGKTEVTQSLWIAVMGSNPSYFTGNDERPVERVSWFEVQQFINKLNQLTNQKFLLPTEAEWEYAAGGGSQDRTEFAGTDNEFLLEKYAWYSENSGSLGVDNPDYGSHPVRQKYPNALGIYDMSGNVEEWVQDWYQNYTIYSQIDPVGTIGGYKVHRGGGWGGFFIPWPNAIYCTVTSRFYVKPDTKEEDLGFRLAHKLRNN